MTGNEKNGVRPLSRKNVQEIFIGQVHFRFQMRSPRFINSLAANELFKARLLQDIRKIIRPRLRGDTSDVHRLQSHRGRW